MKAIITASVIFFLICSPHGSMSQGLPDFSPSQLQVALTKNRVSLKCQRQIMEFYELFGHKLFWSKNYSSRIQLINLIDSASYFGLKTANYKLNPSGNDTHQPGILIDKQDSLNIEIRFTEVTIRFFFDVSFGDYSPDLRYTGVENSNECVNVIALLVSGLGRTNFSDLIQQVELNTKEYMSLKNWIRLYNGRIIDTSNIRFKVSPSLQTDSPSPSLLQILYRIGVLDSVPQNISSSEWKEVLKKAQRLFGLFESGALDNALAAELSVSLSSRVEELNRAINTLRWLRCASERNRHIVVVNIPSANLLAYTDGNISLDSRIIVGKQSTRTPTLASSITQIVFYPYWLVPKKIAVNELLPLIRRDVSYLSANNMVVLNTKGQIVNPHSVNWAELHSGYFPYTLRQSTGCDNSLGIVKLDFYNPFSVYLHDTPWKNLFKRTKRYFSHGCMRVEKAVELSKLILCDKTSMVDSLVNLINPPHHPLIITLTERVPVFILYNTAWIDSTGLLHFSEDVYKKFRR